MGQFDAEVAELRRNDQSNGIKTTRTSRTRTDEHAKTQTDAELKLPGQRSGRRHLRPISFKEVFAPQNQTKSAEGHHRALIPYRNEVTGRPGASKSPPSLAQPPETPLLTFF